MVHEDSTINTLKLLSNLALLTAVGSSAAVLYAYHKNRKNLQRLENTYPELQAKKKRLAETFKDYYDTAGKLYQKEKLKKISELVKLATPVDYSDVASKVLSHFGMGGTRIIAEPEELLPKLHSVYSKAMLRAGNKPLAFKYFAERAKRFL
ncbi:MAG: hypothetical protein ACP5JE_04600 [Thermoplasmata archaeon]